jgi:hypothetical protein
MKILKYFCLARTKFSLGLLTTYWVVQEDGSKLVHNLRQFPAIEVEPKLMEYF